MPRPTKGPRLYLRPAAEQRRARRCYVIRDGRTEISTGCGPDHQREAERTLASHIASKLALPPVDPDRRQDPTRVLVREVLSLYAAERAPELATDHASMDGWIAHLRAWWGDSTLSHVRRSTCKAYVADRTRETALVGGRRTNRPVSDQTARRELEVLSAAIGYWDAEDGLLYRPPVWLPPKAETRRNALSRAEVAALLKATLGWRLEPDGRWTRLDASAIANRAHLRRFLLIALYTGSRTSVVTSLSWKRHEVAPPRQKPKFARLQERDIQGCASDDVNQCSWRRDAPRAARSARRTPYERRHSRRPRRIRPRGPSRTA
jgi:hypothetical protein